MGYRSLKLLMDTQEGPSEIMGYPTYAYSNQTDRPPVCPFVRSPSRPSVHVFYKTKMKNGGLDFMGRRSPMIPLA